MQGCTRDSSRPHAPQEYRTTGTPQGVSRGPQPASSMPYITYITYEPLRQRRSNPASATTNHPPSHRTVHMHAHRDAPSNVPRARECTSHSSPSIHPSGPLRRRDIPLCPHSIAITAITAITAAAAAAMCPRPPRLHAPQHAPPAPPSDPPAAAIPCLGARGAVLTARGRAGCRWGGHAPS